ncbi:putative solute carrier family 22 member 5 isoform X2 [Apostichopus japonicus]|uniref:Putative solute carrier family 22 member 5 isoform X2 n=1 Tax=Stichopus japonicus TaxID=307972 RepID=A0A2G8JW40_STIJA|nr:putative solute carrier family 22 member 5 isoform X2 [Apostichopus japonicus]
MKFDLVCDRKSLPEIAQAVNFAGIMVGSFVLGILADKIGRFYTLYISIISASLFGTLTIHSRVSSMVVIAKQNKKLKIIKKISDVNGVPLPKHDDITDDDDDVTVQYTALDLLRRPILTVRLFTMMFVWFVHTMVYYGLALSAADFGVNIYLSFFLAGLVELPAYTITGFSMELIGRRLATFILMMIALGVIRTCIAMVGKFGVSASFALVYVWAVEIFPTPLRGNSLGLCTLASQSGGIFSPLIILLGAHWAPFPFVVFGGLTIMAGFMALLLPETKGQLMPETIADAEALGRQVHISADFKRFLIFFFS